MSAVQWALFTLMAPVYVLYMLGACNVSHPCPMWLSRFLARRLKLDRTPGKHSKTYDLLVTKVTLNFEVIERKVER